MRVKKVAFCGLAAAMFSSMAWAQDGSDRGMENMAAALPEVCAAPAGMQMPQMEAMPDMPGTSEAHQEMMGGMMRMQFSMMTGMLAEDADVAFVCGMLVHHQGAIDMAKAELEYGDDPWAMEMAQKVIDAQSREIDEMTAWLEERAE